jgi:hypothetical protein
MSPQPSAAHSPTGALAVAVRVALTTRADPAQVRPGAPTTITGTVRSASAPLIAQHLELQASYTPSAPFRNIAHTVSLRDGRFAFAPVRSSRATRYRVIDRDADGLGGPVVTVAVELEVYPSAARVQAAARYLAGRTGYSALAVVDDRGGISGLDAYRRFASASVVKSIMLVAYLQLLAREHRPLDRASQALLYPMIHASDNAAASAVLAIVGQQALERVAREAGMRDYQRASGWWAFTQVSAADMARFFYLQDKLIPRRFDGYARYLESTIEPSQSWGIPAVARPEFAVYFKGGWLPEEGVFDQVARLERSHITFAVAVLTAGEPSMAYGEQTIAGVTQRLLGRAG